MYIYCVLLFFNIISFLASPYGKTKRMRWTETEKETVLEAFAKHMKNQTLPSLRKIQEMKKKIHFIGSSNVTPNKNWLYNKQKTLKRTCKYFILVNFLINLINVSTYLFK